MAVRINSRGWWLISALVVFIAAMAGMWALSSGMASANKVRTITRYYGPFDWEKDLGDEGEVLLA